MPGTLGLGCRTTVETSVKPHLYGCAVCALAAEPTLYYCSTGSVVSLLGGLDACR